MKFPEIADAIDLDFFEITFTVRIIIWSEFLGVEKPDG
jgi:hypothetical protein